MRISIKNILNQKYLVIWLSMIALLALQPAPIVQASMEGQFGNLDLSASSITALQATNSFEQLQSGPTIYSITTNVVDYPSSQIPRYEKFEITFQVDTSAQNLQLPHDPAPPPGISAGIGISVDAYFTPDNWQTVYSQPAFYYEEYEDQVKSGKEWFYPTGKYAWKVRFAPTQVGQWHFKLVAQDSSGKFESESQAFTVTRSGNKGFIRVSREDPRYFEYEDGSYFPGLSYNMNFNHLSWINPVLDNLGHFQLMSQNGIQMVRIWLSQWGIFDSSWNAWNSIDPNLHAQYIPYSGLTFEQALPESEISMRLNADYNPCMFLGFMQAPPAVKRNTTYRVRIRYKTMNITGPRISGQLYGFVAKTGGWLWDQGNNCNDSGTGTLVTTHQPEDTTDWQILEGSLTSGEEDFLPFFYLVLENVDEGQAYIDYVWIEEDLGDGQFGPNIVTKPWMAHHYYMEQRNSYAFDKVIELAEEYGIYIRPVVHEKNGWIFNRIDYDGNPIVDDPACWDSDPNNDPDRCPNNNYFYGNWRETTKVRWLQKAWWRYLQARWGYSTSIHSWELLNEGDPWNGLHYTLADEFGKYMHRFNPNHHLVSTSFWHSFPKDDFWTNPEYPDLDFADIHRYIPSSEAEFYDAALATYIPSMEYGALQAGGGGKPLIRGETGFVENGSEPATNQFDSDSDGIWLHNFIWGSINPGGMIESYWYENEHIYSLSSLGEYKFDHRDQFGTFYNFVHTIPLNNGNYQDAAIQVSAERMRVWGQKDLQNQRAHLWVQNTSHTWRNVIDGVDILPVSGNIFIDGFRPGATLMVAWWDTYSGKSMRGENRIVDENGTLAIQIDQLDSDVALKIYPQLDLDQQIFLPHIHVQPFAP